jgi:hypothetical protein
MSYSDYGQKIQHIITHLNNTHPGKTEIVKLLLEKNNNAEFINSVDKNEMTAINLAEHYGYHEIIELINNASQSYSLVF